MCVCVCVCVCVCPGKHSRYIPDNIKFLSYLSNLPVSGLNCSLVQRYAPPICAKCDVIETPESDIAQSLLPVVYTVALGSSWWLERPRRSLRQFVVDNMKQLVRGCMSIVCANGPSFGKCCMIFVRFL